VGDTDLELVRQMLQGDQAAFERFFDATYPALYRFALPRLTAIATQRRKSPRRRSAKPSARL
jgi:hypothetical protein